ncbi:lasso peptide isopeptide bond-forming cyclase [Streptomyces sp. HC44]|uniref:Lasso peptide isopeptide bond-forming cyclase n=1 Tax=Streptomyces scabichelini TaxID=2711217 RepID=A0A6G4VHM6_9ACTN|nr:lasso peptide isopeptide bond-forming cyclase [Streptomyces scabichelini]NGO13596.1 lasso peptide isopeptide bond-forming cyclase [Streptomyces scabichelini]
MVDFPDSDEGLGWFVVLPDCASAARVGTALRSRAVQEVSHPSGRPWLLGRWSPGVMTVGEAGPTKIAVAGEHAITADGLTAAADRIDTIAGLDELARGMVGSAHLVASVTGRVRVQGSVSGLRRVFHARIGDATVAADRADVLAGLLDAAVDEQRLATRLLNPFAPHPLAGEPVWRGVSALETGRYLALDSAGRGRPVAWWAPPEPVRPMAEGASAFREALSAAVEVRVRGRDVVSCDLGGLDSTSVCALAARGRANVIAYTADGLDPLCDDVTWARRTVAGLGDVGHHIIAGDQLPMVYEGLQDVDVRFDEPCPAAMHPSRCLVIPRLAAARGSRLHLTGFGGDELLAGSPAHLHTLMRSCPRTALQLVRGFAAQAPWPYRETLRQLWDNSSYRAWLARAGDELTAVPPPLETPALDWGTPPRLPPWVTPDAVEAVRELIRTAARTTEPLAERRGQHVELEAMGSNSRMVRQVGEMAARAGITLSAPYYDDRVIEAGLAVRPQDRITPWGYKPLIVEAMRGIVPAESLTRHTKDEGSYEAEMGMREQRAELLALCEDSRLARLGLIDANVLRETAGRPLPPTLPFDALYQTVVCEMWLRTLETATTTVPG